jgi:hypothetical protein
MNSIARWAKCGAAAGLAILAFGGSALAAPGVLRTTPSPNVYPGGTIRFQGEVVFHDPAFPNKPAPGTPMDIAVNNDFFGWVTETKTVTYLSMGSATINFTTDFVVPANVQPGAVLNFWLEWIYRREGSTVYTIHLATTTVNVVARPKLRDIRRQMAPVRRR